jgi:hypothetical protein
MLGRPTALFRGMLIAHDISTDELRPIAAGRLSRNRVAGGTSAGVISM